MTIGKPEATAAVDRLLMMGIRMPETCWAVSKRQTINLQLIAAFSYLNLNDMIYLLTAFGLTPGSSSTVHFYTQTVYRTTQNK